MVSDKAIPAILAAALTAVAAAVTPSSTPLLVPEARTISVRSDAGFLAPPSIRLGTDDRLSVNFDIIGDAQEYLRCRLIHCNADWSPSLLLPSEYAGGFNEAEVTDYAFSSGTYVRYVNYNVTVPSDGLRPLVSGNYLLEVFREDDPDTPVLRQRFMVEEDAAAVSAILSANTDRGDRAEWQQLTIAVEPRAAGISDPRRDIMVTAMQNGRPETLRTAAPPLRTEGNKLIYTHNPALVFRAGNEYRRFETVRADYEGMHVDSVSFDGTWHAWLAPDEPRAGKEYIFDSTQFGRFKVDEYNASDPDLGADYVTVHFALAMPEIPGAALSVEGEFARQLPAALRRLSYAPSLGAYTAAIPLKQGSYNYQYVIVLPGGESSPAGAAASQAAEAGTPSPVEGDCFETRNQYTVCVWLRAPGSRGDRLLKVVTVSPE